jgi:glutamate-1-semialdehyde 2,1-aminomutase
MHQTYGLEPDLIAVGKIIGGGFPVGGVGGSQEIMSVFDAHRPGTIALGGTFSANPVTMVAGQVALSHFDRESIAQLNELGDLFRSHITEAGILVSGYGSLARLQVDCDRQQLWWDMYEMGLLTGTSSLMALSTPMSQDDVETAAQIVIKAVGLQS